MTISPVAADYAWIRSSSSLFGYALEAGYSLVLVRGVSPAELLRITGADPQGVREGLEELVEEHTELVEEYDGWPEASLLGAVSVPGAGGEWTLALDLGGDLGLRPQLMEDLSATTRAVAVTGNSGKPMTLFTSYAGGRLETGFERPDLRDGAAPDALNVLLLEVGLLDAEGGQVPGADWAAGMLALAGGITGVQVTAELLARASYRAGLVPEGTCAH
ncbi:DUF6461 domain-containing protein [Streptomyces sp. NPDC006798]|uniref:DUF6461 domain-containing protein n=1 Tax=Streptomyces sp. NPDC006798 TaxID=3155462 RepID=UPI0033EDB0A9